MMYDVSPALYGETAARLGDAIGSADYYSGTIAFVYGGIECRFTASLIIYRRTVSLPEGDRSCIAGLVPVWWEFRTEGIEGEMLNDFDFAELRDRLVAPY